MKRTTQRTRVVFLVLLTVALLVVGFIFLGGPASVVNAEPKPVLALQKPDNSTCLACHSKPDQIIKLPSGDTVSTTVYPGIYDQSVHANLACQVCHTNIVGYPHPKNEAKDQRNYILQYKDTCKQCHPTQASQLMDSAHTKLANQGNLNAPICADCHNPHTQKGIQKDTNGDPAASEHANIAKICSKCHTTIYDQYSKSVHGAGLLVDKNPDVPACDECHGIHNLRQARTVQFRLNSPQLCATCHTNPSIMDKYHISTDVLNTYVADFHGTTVTLFEKQSPDLPTNKPVCFDCHGVHDISKPNDPQNGLLIKQNLLKACQRCHPNASDNFPDSWMSHYIPSSERYPVVYYVNEFYKYFIPTVIGGMVIFVGSDFTHRLINRRKKGAIKIEAKVEEQPAKVEEEPPSSKDNPGESL